MKLVLAISGGVDSMVLLHLAWQSYGQAKHDLVVAHFDHGIRPDSSADAEFVRQKAAAYGLEYRLGQGRLGPNTSEAKARQARYEFLHWVAAELHNSCGESVEIWTAHHLDDLIESVAINFVRGTGWRGLAVLDSAGVHRPFLDPNFVQNPLDKQRIFAYAAQHQLEYREDPSNSWDEYLRNRLRHQLHDSLTYDQKLEIYARWQQQKQLKKQVQSLVAELVPLPGEPWQRSWFQNLEPSVALELLHFGASRAGIPATRPQLEDFRQAILHYHAGKAFNLPEDTLVKFSRDQFRL